MEEKKQLEELEASDRESESGTGADPAAPAAGPEPGAVEETTGPAEETGVPESETADAGELSAEQLAVEDKASDEDTGRRELRAKLEAAVYITEEPLTAKQLAEALEEPLDSVTAALAELVEEYAKPSHGLVIREVAEGFKMGTKAEYHDSLRAFVKKLQKPLKLSMAALETLAVIAYKQPITAPEIMEIRGVQGAGVLKTLLDRKLITTAGRKNVVGKPMLYRTTKEFLVQFGLKNLNELPTLKEFEELARVALADAEEPAEAPGQMELPTAEAPWQEPEQETAPAPGRPEEEQTPHKDAAATAGASEDGESENEEAPEPRAPRSEDGRNQEPGERKRHAAPEE